MVNHPNRSKRVIPDEATVRAALDREFSEVLLMTDEGRRRAVEAAMRAFANIFQK